VQEAAREDDAEGSDGGTVQGRGEIGILEAGDQEYVEFRNNRDSVISDVTRVAAMRYPQDEAKRASVIS